MVVEDEDTVVSLRAITGHVGGGGRWLQPGEVLVSSLASGEASRVPHVKPV